MHSCVFLAACAAFACNATHALAQIDAEKAAVSETPARSASSGTTGDAEEASSPTESDAAPPPEPLPQANSPSPSTAAPTKEATEDKRNDEDAKLRARVAQLEQTVAELKEAKETAELEAAMEEPEDAEIDLLQIYGFMDMGFQRMWTAADSGIGGLFEANAATFVVGNLDFYFDVNPSPDWRGLAEVRFTGAPHGRINNFGGLGGGFERESTMQFDPNATALNAQMWGGYTVIERAWIEWRRYQSLQIRTGSFFTPFGIWNVDHGSPTLIATGTPQFIQLMYFPLRQVGMQALGSTFAGEWEFAYRAWLSNGRQELSNLDFNDDKAVGARLIARRERGKSMIMAGLSYHHGRVADRVVNITSAPPLTPELQVETEETWAYKEHIIGADVSLDFGKTRFRTEGVAQLRQYVDGLRPPAGFLTPDNVVTADNWRFALYSLLAHRFEAGGIGIEPYLSGELIQQYWEFPDGIIVAAPGLNFHFSPATQLKLQGSHAMFFDWIHEYPGSSIADNNVTTFVSRLVLAF